MSKRAEKGTVPELRFPEFRKRGEWEAIPLDRVITIHKGKGIAKADISPNGKLPCIRYGELYTRYGEIIDEVFSRTDVDPDELFLSEAGDVIIPASGETKEDIATAACVLRDGVALGGDLNVLRSEADGAFLSYYINHSKKRAIANLAQGDAVVHLYPHQLKKLTLTIPAPDEKQKIAACLTSVDALLVVESVKLEVLRAHKKGLMQQLFPAEGAMVPALRFPGFGTEWKKVRLGSIGNTLNGLAGKSAADFGLGKPFVTYKQVYASATVDFSKCSRVAVGDNETQNALRKGDVLFTTSSETPHEVGYASVLLTEPLEPTYLNSFCFALRFQKQKALHVGFCRYLFHSPMYRGAVGSLAQGSTRYNISKGSFLDLMIPIPESKQEQEAIDACLSSLEDNIHAQADRISTLVEHKKGLMQGLFPTNKT